MPNADRVRLISDNDDDDEGENLSQVRSRRSTSDDLASGNVSRGDNVDDARDINSVLVDVLGEQIVSVFVAAFHTRSGNIIEWSTPQDVDLSGVEFKALVSGCHVLNQDFVYFRKGRYYGLACYKQLRIESTEERGARMKAVGILATSYTCLHRYMKSLYDLTEEILQRPGEFGSVERFFEENKAKIPHSSQIVSGDRPRRNESIPKLYITHPAGCFSQMIAFFGEQIICLWKCSLLRKRIIFFSPPPIGVVCYRVYCCCCMADHGVSGYKQLKPLPYFYVNIADIDVLNDTSTFVACTTEKIFESKKALYDVYVDNQNIIINSENQDVKKLSETTEFDQARFEQLNNLRMGHVFHNFSDDEGSEEEEFISFFRAQNDKILTILRDTAMSLEPVITEEHARAMGLDPEKDKAFLTQLVELYDIHVTLRLETPCC